MKKNKLKKVLSMTLALVLAFGVLTGCGNTNSLSASGSETNDTSKSSTKRLNIALQPTPNFLPVKYLSDNGWVQDALKEAGYNDIEVTFTEFESGPPEYESFAAGQQDIGVIGNVPTISGIAAGQERTIIGISVNGEHTQGTVVAADSDIDSLEELAGKKVGLVVGSLSQDMLDSQLETIGLTTDDVELVNLTTGEQQQALANGEVDAVTTWNPTLTKIQADGIGKLLADGTGVYLGENTIFVQTEYLNTNREIVEIFLEQYAKAVNEIKADQEQFAEDYAEIYGLDVDILLKVLQNTEYPLVITDEDVQDLQGTADFLYNNEIIPAEVKVSDFVDTTFNETYSGILK